MHSRVMNCKSKIYIKYEPPFMERLRRNQTLRGGDNLLYSSPLLICSIPPSLTNLTHFKHACNAHDTWQSNQHGHYNMNIRRLLSS
jgi:hypothetical protein